MTVRILTSVAALSLLCAAASAERICGARHYTGPDPIGGGPGYTRLVDPAKARRVSTLEELKAALAAAQAGDIIYLDDRAEIDATGSPMMEIPGGVTLASGRGSGGSPGALIRFRDYDCPGVFTTGGDGVRVTGLRMVGPDTEEHESAYELPNSRGITIRHPRCEVDNCDISGFSHAGVYLVNAGTGHRIHHNFLHHCRRRGLGYGVCLASTQAYIVANRFLNNRHDIAGTGRAGTAYLACSNISDITEGRISHAFDMHGNHESRRPDEVVEPFAGDWVVICHNTFYSYQPRMYTVIRGRPRQHVTIFANEYHNALHGARFSEPCDNAVIFGDCFIRPPAREPYFFNVPGNRVDGKVQPATAQQ
jgi:hypothetical protein